MGTAGTGAMGGSFYKCSIIKQNWPTPLLGKVCTADRDKPVGADLARKFAPQLRSIGLRSAIRCPRSRFFDRLAKDRDGNPVFMPGSAPIGVENTSKSNLGAVGIMSGGSATNQMPTYYQIRTFGNQVRIQYWCSTAISTLAGRARGRITATGSVSWSRSRRIATAIAAVTFWQHGGWYTRIAGPRDAPCTPGGTGRCAGQKGFQTTDSTHPVVYVGRIAHGSYHVGDKDSLGTFDQCFYYGDVRDPGQNDNLIVWSNTVLDLDDLGEPWMFKDLWSPIPARGLESPPIGPGPWRHQQSSDAASA